MLDAPKLAVVHPPHRRDLFAEQMIEERALRQGDDRQRRAVLSDVYVYRGQPGNRQQPAPYGITPAQKAEWERDRRVHVTYRSLKYSANRPPQEKGVDVLVALNLVRLAQAGDHDVVVLAAHDTDQEPALEMAATSGRAKVETCGWAGSRRRRVPGRALRHTAVPGNRLPASRDRRTYA